MMPEAPALPPPPPNPATFADAKVQGAGQMQTTLAKQAGSTILTSGQGDIAPATLGKKTLLGQ